MPDRAEELARIYQAGFEIERFGRFPQAVGVGGNQCVALLQGTPEGLSMLGVPGSRMGEVMGVLTEKDGQKVFHAKQQVVEATPELLERLQAFERELRELLNPVT